MIVLKVFVVSMIISSLIGLIRTDEEQCTLIFDDCHTCVSTEGCGWCDAGFCLSQTDSLFTCKNELTIDDTVCPSSTTTRNKRSLCSISGDCSECNLINGCAWCVYYPDPNIVFETCQDAANPDSKTCPMSSYTIYNSSFIINCPNSGVSTEPTHGFTKNPASGPSIGKKRHEISARIPDPKIAINLTADDVCLYLVRGLNQRFQEVGSATRVSTANCEIQIWRNVYPAFNSSTIPPEANAELQMRWIGVSLGQVIEIENTTTYIIEHYNPYILPIVIAKFSGGGGSTPLSPGQVAGIAIGSILAFFFLLLLLLLLLLILIRRRPQTGPFRAPHASFRP